ncbi:MAG: collagen-like triple helix repeat-containing protein, partial [Magnetococcales bacterium]|nr:collagen-like triple helix repeat-containing protein [Magnetococcales bacterium]
MFEWLANLINLPGFPWGVSALIVLWGLFSLVRLRTRVIPMHQGLQDAIAALSRIQSPLEFAKNLETLDTTLANNATLTTAWRSYRSTLFLSGKTASFQSSDAAGKHLNLEGLGHPFSELKALGSIPAHLANTGLVFTFFSLIVAIHIEADDLLSHTDGPSFQAIQHLFQVTSFKFLTAIAGIICAMTLTAVMRKHMSLLENRLNHMAGLLDRFVQEVPREALVLEQIATISQNTEPHRDLLEQWPQLADAVSTQLAADLDHHLGGMIQQVTRQFVDEARRENAHHQKNQESLLAELREQLAPLAQLGHATVTSVEASNAELLVQMQHATSEQTLVKPILQSVHEAFQHVLETVRPAPSEPPDLDSVLHAMRQELHQLQESLIERIQQSTPEQPDLHPIEEALKRLEEATHRPPALMEPMLQSMMDEVFKLRTTLQVATISGHRDENLPSGESARIEPVLEAFGEKLLQIQETVRQLSPSTPDFAPVLQSIREEGRQIRQAIDERPTVAWMEEHLTQGLAHLGETVRHTLDWDGLLEKIRSEQDKTTQSLKTALEDIQDAITTPAENPSPPLAPPHDVKTTLAPILQTIQQERVTLSQQMEQFQETLQGRMSAMEEDWRAALATLEVATPDDTGTTQSLESLRQALHDESMRLSGQLEHVMGIIQGEMAQAAENRQQAVRELLQDTTGELVQKLSLDPLLNALQGETERLSHLFAEEQTRLHARLDRLAETGQGMTVALDGLANHIDETSRLTREAIATKNQTIPEILEGMQRLFREELAQTTAHQHQWLHQRFGDDAAASERTLDPLLKMLNEMNGDLHRRMEEMLAALRQETDHLREAQGDLLNLFQQTNPAVATMRGDHQPAWDETLSRLNETLGRQIETVVTVIHKEGAEVIAAHGALLQQQLENFTRHDDLQQTISALTHSLEGEQSQTMAYLDQFKKAVGDEARFIADQHLEALRAALAEQIENHAERFSLAPLLEAMDHHAANQVQRNDLETATQALSQAVTTQAGQVIQHLDRSIQAATQPLGHTIDTQAQRVMDHVGITIENATKPLYHTIEGQGGRIVEHLNRSLPSATHPLLHAVETQAGRIMEHVGITVQNANQPLLHAVESQAGHITTHVDRSIQSAIQPVLRTVETQAGRVVEHVGFTAQHTSQPLLHAVESQAGRILEQMGHTIQLAHQPLFRTVETQAGRVMEHLDRSIQAATQPVMQAVEDHAGRIMEHGAMTVQNATQPLAQSLEAQGQRVMDHVTDAVQNAAQPLAQSLEAQGQRVMDHVTGTVQNATQPLAQSLEAQGQRVMD